MIFVSVGTERFQFNRLLAIVDKAIESGKIVDSVFAQIGNCTYKPKNFPYVKFLDFEQMLDCVKKAEICIFHASGGAIMMCFPLKKKPILFPRSASLGEHLDDHQARSSEEFVSCGIAFSADSGEELIRIIDSYPVLLRDSPLPPTELPRLTNFLHSLMR